MAVTFEFVVEKGFHFAQAFGSQFGLHVVNDRVAMPADLADGYIQEVFLASGISLCIHHYVLKQDFILKRASPSSPADSFTFKWDCRQRISKTKGELSPIFSRECEVEFATSNFFTELTLPAGQHIEFMVIGISRQNLINLLQIEEGLFANIDMLRHNPSFLVHEFISPDMLRILKQIMAIDSAAPLYRLHYQARAEELIYLFFLKLVSRASDQKVPVNTADAGKIYELRDTILADISTPPRLEELAKQAGMSLTKMKQLFRQIFGDSIYNYYQRSKMEYAAHLLKEHSVSETGYKLGFTNMSHFTRLFEKHFGIKPKKFKDTLD